MIPQPDDPPAGEWALRGRAVCTPEGIRPAAVLVRGERIAGVVGPDEVPAGIPVEDADDKLVLPGLVDTHVHINEPGRTEWEGFATATRAAAAGGVTTLIDMPLNSSPVTTTVEALRRKRQAAAGQLWVDCGFHAGVVPGNADQIEPLIAEGVCAFKAFLCPSGIDEFPAATESDLRAVMPKLAGAGVPLFVHAELVSPLPPGVEETFAANPRSYAAYLATRPPEWEVAAIRLMIEVCREYRCPVHIVHLSAAEEAWPLVSEARQERLPFTLETCPHYLTFADKEIPDGDPRYKCAPPIRHVAQRALLRSMLIAKRIHTIGSDHSPAPPDLKRLNDGDLRAAWGGIASLQLLLPATWSSVDWCANLPREHVIAALTTRPAALTGLAERKGAIAAGCDADLVVFDSDAQFAVTPEMFHHRHKTTPYLGYALRGIVDATYLRGRKVYERGQILSGPTGQLLERSRGST
jgi:allantoinase